jgi:hypothetical protein
MFDRYARMPRTTEKASQYQSPRDCAPVITESLNDTQCGLNSAQEVPTWPAIKQLLPQGPVRHERRIPQPPSPPGLVRAGPVVSVYGSIPNVLQAGFAPAFIFVHL